MKFKDRHMVGGAAAACAVCCAAPVVGLLGVAGFAATAVTLAFAGVVFAVVVGLASVVAVVVRRARSRPVACATTDSVGPVELELGAARAADIG
ncbi:hypothetical protein EXE58_18945 [Nocardioides seonyuensis]|uniref:Uncharacterized protein n=1 Tax=Nocardioides seonyuensis TaxID=2518371 RepID=A0A4P7IJU5_9ACTN|nr:hypothetical protein [Nocardioides seonyuensis]QBX57739.1 hypothetical protein EXE58_18945 [Nocardioides seonyuensis]